MTDPFVAVTVAEAFMQFSQATVSAVGRAPRGGIPHPPPRSVVHSFQLRVYEQGTRARLIEAEGELRALRRERDDALRDLDACKDQTRACVAEVDRWKTEARPCPRLTLASCTDTLTLHLLVNHGRCSLLL